MEDCVINTDLNIANQREKPHLFSYSHHTLLDRSRKPFKVAIDRLVKPTDVVLDIGTGVGVLALFAASRAAKVYAVEDDTMFTAVAKRIFSESPHADRLELRAVKSLYDWEVPEPIDILLCDQISTGLVLQPQAPLINFYRPFLKPGGKIVPEGITNFLSLTHANFHFYDLDFICSFHERPDLPKAITLSERSLLETINFYETIPLEKTIELPVRAVTHGIVNSVRLESHVQLASDIIISDSPTLCRPIVFAIPPSQQLSVNAGETINVKITYSHAIQPRYIPQDVQISLSREPSLVR